MGKTVKKPKADIRVTGIEQYGNFKNGWVVKYKIGANKYQGTYEMYVDEFLQWRPDFTKHIENLKKGAPPYKEEPRVKGLLEICKEMTEEYYGKKD